MPTEKQTDQACLDSRDHWEENVETYPYRASADEKYRWFKDNCDGDKCALCGVFHDDVCVGCPLDDFDGEPCCHEWNELQFTIIARTSRKRHVVAVRDRLLDVCKERGLNDD